MKNKSASGFGRHANTEVPKGIGEIQEVTQE